MSRQSGHESSVVYQTLDKSTRVDDKVRISLQDLRSSRIYGQHTQDVRRNNPQVKQRTESSVYNSLQMESGHRRSSSTNKKSQVTVSSHNHYKSVNDAAMLTIKPAILKQQTFDSSRNKDNLIITEVTLGKKRKPKMITIKNQQYQTSDVPA